MKKIIALFLIVFCASNIDAQEQFGQKKFKVGVVLSGGGAKGLAHIGALKKIDSAGIQIDYIAGTSMGAIIGGLYAAGYTPHQLDSIFKETNFNKLIQDDLPRTNKTFNERKDTDRYAVMLPFDNFKLSFPSGLSKGQNIYNLLSQLLVHVNNIENFENLPTPFFCIATDIETGEEIVLDHGSLPQSISASGAIPSLFSPVEINGRLLSDGGITNNYPVEKLKAKGVDYIIGIDVQDSLASRKDLVSVFDVMTQVNNFRTINDMKDKRGETDLYIKPNIENFSILSFEKGTKIIESGEEAVLNVWEELQTIAEKQNRKNEDRVYVKPLDSLMINDFTVSGNITYPRKYLQGKLKLRNVKKLSFKQLNRSINNLSASGNFRRIEYCLMANEDKYDLHLMVSETEGNTYLRLALHYDQLYRSAALLNITKKRLVFPNDIISFDAIVGDNFRYDFQYYIDKGDFWSLGVNSRFNQFKRDVGFDFVKENSNIGDFNVNEVRIEYQDFTNQFYAETFFLKSFKLGLGAEHKYTEIETRTILDQNSTDELPFTILEQSNLYSAFGYLEFDTYDNFYFPTSGVYFNGMINFYVFGSKASYDFSEFSIAKGKAGYAFRLFNKFGVRLETDTGFRFGNNDMSALNFFLGGYGNQPLNNIVSFYGYDFLEISANSYIRSKIEFDYEIFRKNHIVAGYNIANAEDNLYETGNWLSLPDYTGFGLGYGLETLLGPLEVKYTYSPETFESRWFVSLGYWF